MRRSKKIIGVAVIGLLLCGGIMQTKFCSNEQEFSSFTIRSGQQITIAYVNGENITDEIIELEEQVMQNVAEYFHKEQEELQFEQFCLLEMEGITVEVEVDGIWHTVECDMEGNVV